MTVEKESFGDYSIETIANELNRVLNNFYPIKSNANKRPETNKIYNIELIESKSFYGFRETNQQFLRFQFLNPRSVKQAFKLIKQGKLFDRKCNIYEAHITYIMQFFVNFKLAGMNFVHLDNYLERKSRDRRMMSKDKQYFIRVEKQSICQLEIDIIAQNIVVVRNDHKFINPGLVLVWSEEKRRLIESNKDIKGIFKSNLKDNGDRSYTKKSLELNYLEQLKDYFNFKENFNLFHQQYGDRPFDDVCNRSVYTRNSIENLNPHSLSQSVIERIIRSEKELIDSNQMQQFTQQSIRSKLLNSKDIRSQEFISLIRKIHDNSLNKVLNDLENKNETDSDDSSVTDDELDIEKQTRFTQLMLKTKNSFRIQNDEFELNESLDRNYLSKENFRSDDKSMPDEEKLSQHKSQTTHSDSLDPNNFNLDNESLIDTPTDSQKTKDQSLESNDSRMNLKRSCTFDDQFEIGHLVSLNDEPLFEDDEDDYNFNKSLQKSTPSPLSQSNQLSQPSQPYNLNEFSQPQSESSQTDNKSIFSFYSLGSIDENDDFTSTPFSSSQPKTPVCPTDESKNENEKNLNLQDQQQQKSTSTPLNIETDKVQTDKYRIRTSLGTKFMKLSKEESSPRTQSPLTLPIIQVQSPPDSLNRSNKSTQSIGKHSESSFTMNEKIQHLSESTIDYSSPMTSLTHENQNLTTITMELFVTTEHDLKPNPFNDSIKMIFYMIYNDYTREAINQDSINKSKKKKHFIGIIAQEANIDLFNQDLNKTTESFASNSSNAFNLTTHTKKRPRAIDNWLYFQNRDDDVEVECVNNELSLIERFIKVLIDHDPDIITGYEIETSSWGYLISRAELLRIDISVAFSRLLMDFNQISTAHKPTNSQSTTENTNTDEQLKTKQKILNRTQCEEDDDQFELSDQEDLIVDQEEDAENDNENDVDINPIINNNYLNRNKWESLEKFKQKRHDFGTIKTR